MTFFPADLLIIATINFVALLSPGPNFAMIVQHSLTLSRGQALSAALGIASAGFLHQLIVIIGLGILISQSPVIMKIIHCSGAVYLAYLGIQLLDIKHVFSKNPQGHPQVFQQEITPTFLQQASSSSCWVNSKQSFFDSFLKGFIFNILNPVSLLFFLGIFSSSIRPETARHYQVIYAMVLALMDLSWYSLTALIFSQRHVQEKFFRYRVLIDRCTGILLLTIAMGCLYEM